MTWLSGPRDTRSVLVAALPALLAALAADFAADRVLPAAFAAERFACPAVDFADFAELGKSTHPANLVGLTFKEDQPGFLAGALAGLMTQTNVIGAVAGVYWFCKGFRLLQRKRLQVDIIGIQKVGYTDQPDALSLQLAWLAQR